MIFISSFKKHFVLLAREHLVQTDPALLGALLLNNRRMSYFMELKTSDLLLSTTWKSYDDIFLLKPLWCFQVEELYDAYCIQRRLRDGASKMVAAFNSATGSREARESLSEANKGYREYTEASDWSQDRMATETLSLVSVCPQTFLSQTLKEQFPV